MRKKLLYIVDDEAQIRQLLQSYLEKEGYDVGIFYSGEEALETFDKHPCDLWIIDIMMPGMDGYTLCREIRARGETPVIIVSAKDEEIDRILGLELGSDDYISKPFSPRELVVRIKNLLRRMQNQQSEGQGNLIHIGNITINTLKRVIHIDDTEVTFTAKEYALLIYMAQNRNIALSREQIIDTIWGYEYPGDMRQVDDLVKRVRRKLLNASKSVALETVWGFGYKLRVEG